MTSFSATLKLVKRNDASVVSVNWPQCGNLSAKELRALCEAMQSNTVVTSLRLCNLGSERAHQLLASNQSAGQLLADVLQVNGTLRRLTLDSMLLSGDDVAQLAAAVATNDALTLRSLSLADNPVEPHGVIAFSAMLMSNTTLVSLCLASNDLLDAATMQHVSLALELNSTLEELDLWKADSCNDTVVTVLARALKSNRALRWLRLNASTSSADTIQHFAETLTDHNFVLSELDAFAYSTDELDAALKRNKSLQWPAVRADLFDVATALRPALLAAPELVDAILLAANPYLEFADASRRRRCIEHVFRFDTRPVAPAVALEPDPELQLESEALEDKS